MDYSFYLTDEYRPESGDLILLPYLKADTPMFVQDIQKLFPCTFRCHEEEGRDITLFRGDLDGKECLVRTLRLDKKHFTPVDVLKEKVSRGIELVESEGLKRLVLSVDAEREMGKEFLIAVLEGVVLGGYRFQKYLSDKKESPRVVCHTGRKLPIEVQDEIEKWKDLLYWVNRARDCLNEPPSVMNPVALAEQFTALGKEAGLKVHVWDHEQLEKERMNALLAVGKGSIHPPRLVIGEHRSPGTNAHLVLVGKGVTFDTGGYCLKPADAQIGMKYDMGGAAACFCAACAISRARLPLNLTVITPLCENAISSRAYKTTDLIMTRSGKSVQVDNTDAEGRLILADALSLASERRPNWLIDVATLTGACVVALGEDIAGIMGQDKGLMDTLKAAGQSCGELFWELPLHMPYREQLKAEIADIKNIGKRWGGAITGAVFLKEFVPDEIPWVHADIAGPAVKEDPLGHIGKGAKGFGVKTLYFTARKLASGIES